MTAQTPLPGPDAGLAELRDDLRALRATWAWAFAHAHGCTRGRDPQTEWAARRERDLVARITELAP